MGEYMSENTLQGDLVLRKPPYRYCRKPPYLLGPYKITSLPAPGKYIYLQHLHTLTVKRLTPSDITRYLYDTPEEDASKDCYRRSPPNGLCLCEECHTHFDHHNGDFSIPEDWQLEFNEFTIPTFSDCQIHS